MVEVEQICNATFCTIATSVFYIRYWVSPPRRTGTKAIVGLNKLTILIILWFFVFGFLSISNSNHTGRSNVKYLGLDTCLEEVFVNLFLVHILHTPWLWVPAWTTIGLIKYHAWTPFMSEAFSALTYNTWWYEYINSKIWNKKLPLCPSIGGLSMNGQRRSLGLLIIDFFGILDPPLVIKRPWHWP